MDRIIIVDVNALENANEVALAQCVLKQQEIANGTETVCFIKTI